MPLGHMNLQVCRVSVGSVQVVEHIENPAGTDKVYRAVNGPGT